MRTLTTAVLVLPLLALAAPASAAPPTGPVRLEYTVPADVKTGDEVTTTITLKVSADLDSLVVSTGPYDGLELLSDPGRVEYGAGKRGETRQVTVRIKLTGERFGSLPIIVETMQGKRAGGFAQSIIYGNSRKQ